MKIAVFSDIHGSVSGVETMLQIAQNEAPDKIVVCGDLFGGWTSFAKRIAELLDNVDVPLYLVRGNNDRPHDEALLQMGMDDYAVMYHFGRKLFFTHGDKYNKYNVPPILGNGDVLVYGHTHCSLLQRFNDLYVANVGSLVYPRDGCACYMIIDESGCILKQVDGKEVYTMSFLPESL